MKVGNSLKKVWIKSPGDRKQTEYIRFSLGKAEHSMHDIVPVRIIKQWSTYKKAS